MVDLATGGASQTNSGITEGFGGTIVGHAPVDSVEEFRGSVYRGYAAGSRVQLWVMPTNEELIVARQCKQYLESNP